MQSRFNRLGWGVAAFFALLFAASMSGIVQGGSLDPPGPPTSTMKSLSDIPSSWNRELSATGGCASLRFQCIFNDLAVIDRETGLVWERNPTATTTGWAGALEGCAGLAIDGKLGWRLPTIEELLSLVLLDAGDDLPDGHPFGVAPTQIYWSATTNGLAAGSAYATTVAGNGSVTTFTKATLHRKWCVRGGQGIEGQ